MFPCSNEDEPPFGFYCGIAVALRLPGCQRTLLVTTAVRRTRRPLQEASDTVSGESEDTREQDRLDERCAFAVDPSDDAKGSEGGDFIDLQRLVPTGCAPRGELFAVITSAARIRQRRTVPLVLLYRTYKYG